MSTGIHFTKYFGNAYTVYFDACRFTTGDAFVGYQEDTAATILLCAIHQLPEDRDETEVSTANKDFLVL